MGKRAEFREYKEENKMVEDTMKSTNNTYRKGKQRYFTEKANKICN